MAEFEKMHNITEIKKDLFISLFKDNEIKDLYFITLDYNFIKRFYAETETKAIEIYNDFIKNLH